MLRRELPEGWHKGLPTLATDSKRMATRDASGRVLTVLAKNVPWLMTGSVDVGPCCKTRLPFEDAGDFNAENSVGRNLHFGIREARPTSLPETMQLVVQAAKQLLGRG